MLRLLSVAVLIVPGLAHCADGRAAFVVGDLSPEQPTSRQLRAPEPAGRQVKRVLLLGASPDGHPWSTHEYMAGLRIIAQCLQPVKNVQTIIVKADDPWTEGPELLDGADGVVMFLAEGAKWLGRDKRRLAAFRRLAERGGGLLTLHWAMGTKDAKYIEDYVKLFGGCHGGPDRRYKIVKAVARPAAEGHPVLKGIEPFAVRDEFYYELKLIGRSPGRFTPLIKVPIDGAEHTVAWAWERPDGGRSFGFSGGHFHANWKLPEYRRLTTQAVLWALRIPAPENALPLKVSEKDLTHPRPRPTEQKP